MNRADRHRILDHFNILPEQIQSKLLECEEQNPVEKYTPELSWQRCCEVANKLVGTWDWSLYTAVRSETGFLLRNRPNRPGSKQEHTVNKSTYEIVYRYAPEPIQQLKLPF